MARFYDENDQLLERKRSYISKAAQRQQLQLSLTAPENATYVKIGIFNQTEEVNVYFDNVKVTFNDFIIQENHYFPFGMNMVGIEKQGTPDHKFQYNGKEKQEEIGFYDYGARHYDASLGRWFVVDPLAESQVEYSPYHYTYGNPILFNDPTGMIGENSIEKTVVDPSGKVIYHDDDPYDNNIYYSSDGVTGSDGNTDYLPILGKEKSGYNYRTGEVLSFGHLEGRSFDNWWTRGGEDDASAYKLVDTNSKIVIFSVTAILDIFHPSNFANFSIVKNVKKRLNVTGRKNLIRVGQWMTKDEYIKF